MVAGPTDISGPGLSRPGGRPSRARSRPRSRRSPAPPSRLRYGLAAVVPREPVDVGQVGVVAELHDLALDADVRGVPGLLVQGGERERDRAGGSPGACGPRPCSPGSGVLLQDVTRSPPTPAGRRGAGTRSPRDSAWQAARGRRRAGFLWAWSASSWRSERAAVGAARLVVPVPEPITSVRGDRCGPGALQGPRAAGRRAGRRRRRTGGRATKNGTPLIPSARARLVGAYRVRVAVPRARPHLGFGSRPASTASRTSVSRSPTPRPR